MKELATIFEEALELRKQAKHYEAGLLMANTANRLKMDLDDLLDLLTDYRNANK